MKDKLILLLKGLLMGICDLIPGISGGTIAFITGIYERLIKAVKSFSPQLAINIIKLCVKKDKKTINDVKKGIKDLDLLFLIVLFAGIMTSIFLGSRIIKFLLEDYFVFTISFFTGLILASSKVIYDKIEEHKFNNLLFGLFGLVVGVLLAVLIPVEITPNYLYVFVSGFLAISAMFLPGISGAFILLILGAYEFMLDVLHNLVEKIWYFIVFSLGAVLGALAISRVVAFLFKKDRSKTLYFLLGLVIGALSIPVKRVIASDFSWSLGNSVIAILLLILGILVVGFVVKLEKRKK